MPIPGPRTQTGPVPGYDNPGYEQPHRFNDWERPGPVAWPGESSGLSIVSRRGMVLGEGQIRRFWKQSVDLIAAAAPYSWTGNGPSPDHPSVSMGGVGITRALRYMTRSVYAIGGVDNTRYPGLHTRIPKFNRGKRVTVNAGQRQGTPTVRNRMSSFGSRVPTLNQPSQDAQQ